MSLTLMMCALVNWALAGWNLDNYINKGHWYSLAVVFTSILAGLYCMIVALRVR